MDRVGIIIPFEDDNELVRDCISKCFQMDYPDFMIILLPDREIKLDLSAEHNCRVQTIVCAQKNIAQKRNIAMEKFDYPFYAFIDSDAYPSREWLKMAMAVFEQEPQIIAVTGPNLSPGGVLRKRATANAVKSIFVSGSEALLYREQTVVKRSFMPTASSCNLVIRRSVLRDIGNMKETYETGEDKEFTSRMSKKGKFITYDRGVVVYHHSRRLWFPFILQRFTYGLSVPRILKDDPRLLNLMLLVPALFILFLSVLSALSFIYPLFLKVLASVIWVYFFAIALEAFRWSNGLKEFPLTLTAIAIGNLVPGAGTILGFMGTKLKVKNIYRNWD